MNQSENFIFIGEKNNILFYLRMVSPGADIEELCGQVYNLHINEDMLNADDNIFIFNITKDEIIPVQVNHKDMAFVSITVQQLKNILCECVNADRNNDDSVIIITSSAKLDILIPLKLYIIDDPELIDPIKAVIKNVQPFVDFPMRNIIRIISSKEMH